MAKNLNSMSLAEVEAQIAAYQAQIQNSRSRWADSDGMDCATSERAAYAGLDMAEARAEIIRNGGAPFQVLCKDGVVVAKRIEPGKFGKVWVDRTVAKWVFVTPGKEAAKGYTVETRILPAKVTCDRLFNASVELAD